jgi:hypothetical protein
MSARLIKYAGVLLQACVVASLGVKIDSPEFWLICLDSVIMREATVESPQQ